MTIELGWTQKVLDHGYLKLIDYMGSDESIVEAARMSTGRGFVSWEPYERCKECQSAWLTRLQDAGIRQMLIGIGCATCNGAHTDPMPAGRLAAATQIERFPRGDFGLLETLWSSGHSTPFEMVVFSVEAQAPLMVFREWHRHRTGAYSEFSARYAQMPNLHYLPELSRVQKQSKTMKQGSGEALPAEDAQRFLQHIQEEQEEIYNFYDEAISRDGIANELARINTPVSRYSKHRAIFNLRNWFHFLGLRMAPTAQYEIRQYANAIAEIVKGLYPKSWQLFEEHTLNAVRFSKTEIETLRGWLNTPLEGGPTLRAYVEHLDKNKRAAFLKKLGLES